MHTTLWILTLIGLTFSPLWANAHEETNKEEAEDEAWDVNAPPGPKSQQTIEVTEGTWITVDVSPDGETIVFDLLGDLYLMPIAGADGSNGSFPSKLTDGMAWDMQPRFSPDGKRVAFTSDRTGASKHGGNNLWIIGIDGEGLTQVSNETYQTVNGPTWAPDGNYLVGRKHFTSRRSLGSGEMWLYHCGGVDAKADGGVQLTTKPNEQKDVNEPAYSPDGKYLYFSQDSTPGDVFEYDKDSNKQIYVVKRLDLETGDLESYITGPGGACRPTPSHDGKRVAFVRRIGAKTGLHVFDTESGAVRVVTDRLERDMQEAWAIHGVYPAFSWTPDDESIVIWARGQIRKIRVSDGMESTIPFQINDTRTVLEALRFPIDVAPDEFDVRMLRWVRVSPDGKQVIYQALGQLYIRELPTGEPRALTTDRNQFAFCPSFSRDGKHVAYTTWNDETLGTLCVRSFDSGETLTLTDLPGHYFDPVFSPDGKTIVFRKGRGGYLRSHLWSQETGLFRVPTAGGKVEPVRKGGSSPQFGVDSDRLFYLSNARGKDADNLKLMSCDLNGHEERVHYTSKWATDYQLSPDGQRIAFVERFNVYHAPFVNAGKAIDVGPGAKGLPITKVSQDAGDWIHFSGDSNTLHWSMGPDLYSVDLTNPDKSADDEEAESEAERIAIGFTSPHAVGGHVALLGGKVISMGDAGVIEDSAIVIEGNRIVAVGPRADITIPEEATVVDVSGQVILPGYVDTHAHGSQASDGITPQHNWVDYARLAFGVTTIHDPSNSTQEIFAASELTKAGLITAPRTFSTGTILYGATGNFKAEVASLEDAKFHLKRMKAVGAFSVKSYNQPRRDQRQQIVTAARELEMMVVPEGGSLFMSNMTMVVDGHTGVEHTLPVQYVYDDVMDLWRGTGVGYTPTLCVAYGGMSGEIYWYQESDLWEHDRLKTFIPPQILNPRSRRRPTAPLEDFNHIKVASITKQLVDNGNLVQAGGHGQLNGICTHWEMWSFVQGGMTPIESLRCGTLNGARYLGLDKDLGSIEPGKLADLIVIETGYDPSKDIRHSERIQYVMANGRLFDAATMNEIGDDAAKPRQPFYWISHGPGIARAALSTSGCLHCRPGASRFLN